ILGGELLGELLERQAFRPDRLGRHRQDRAEQQDVSDPHGPILLRWAEAAVPTLPAKDASTTAPGGSILQCRTAIPVPLALAVPMLTAIRRRAPPRRGRRTWSAGISTASR